MVASLSWAQPATVELPPAKRDITGDRYTNWVKASQPDLLAYLEGVFPESEGYLITAPVAPHKIGVYPNPFNGPHPAHWMFGSPRVIAPSLAALKKARALAKAQGVLPELRDKVFAFRGVTLRNHWNREPSVNSATEELILVQTVAQTRFMQWYAHAHESWPKVSWYETPEDLIEFGDYARRVSDYLHAVDLGQSPEPPIDPNVPEEFWLYPPRPDYVIDGYQNYKDFIKQHAAIETRFASGILSFTPSNNLLDWFKRQVEPKAYPNKEYELFQEEYREFIERGGDFGVIKTLTADLMRTLRPGEYFFGVNIAGKLRVGYEIPREEVQRIEEQTGRKVARANHAFLFHGEPLVTAGAFFVENAADPRIVRVNAVSGHYFYSNITPTIREDIATRSDEYLLSLGHFFAALDRLGIPYDGIVIEKMAL